MLAVSTDVPATVTSTDISLVCVGTPSTPAGGLSTTALEQVTREIGAALATKDALARGRLPQHHGAWHLRGVADARSWKRASGKKAGVDFGVCVNPEFLREAPASKDFLDPPKTVVGQSDERSGAMVMSTCTTACPARASRCRSRSPR